MDPDHNLPPVPTGQSSQPQVQEQLSLSVGPEHGESGNRPGLQSQSVATEKLLLGSPERHSPTRDRSGPYVDFEPAPHAPPVTRIEHVALEPSRRSDMDQTRANASGIGWIVPKVEHKVQRRTIGERLAPTIEIAKTEGAICPKCLVNKLHKYQPYLLGIQASLFLGIF